MSITLRNRNITVKSSPFQGNKDDIAVLLVSLHKQLRIHKVQTCVPNFLIGSRHPNSFPQHGYDECNVGIMPSKLLIKHV